jgi:hypothetical protein
MLARELAGIADADDSSRRVVAEDEGRKRHRGCDRFKRSRRQIDDEPADLAFADLLEAMRDRREMPVLNKDLARRHSRETLVSKRQGISPESGMENLEWIGNYYGHGIRLLIDR